MSRRLSARAAEAARRSFHYIAIALLAAYLVLAFLVRELGVDRYEKQFLGSTLLILLLAALAHAAGQSETQKGVEQVSESVTAIAERLSLLSGENSPRITLYDGKARVYRATTAAIAAASDRVWVTHLRDDGPLQGQDAQAHFDSCRQWALKHGGFRRIILRGQNDRLRAFCESERKFAAEANQDDSHLYLVRLLPDARHLTEAFNVGIYDDVVFFMHRDGDQAFGFSIRGDKMVNHIARYYERLWNLAEPIS